MRAPRKSPGCGPVSVPTQPKRISEGVTPTSVAPPVDACLAPPVAPPPAPVPARPPAFAAAPPPPDAPPVPPAAPPAPPPSDPGSASPLSPEAPARVAASPADPSFCRSRSACWSVRLVPHAASTAIEARRARAARTRGLWRRGNPGGRIAERFNTKYTISSQFVGLFGQGIRGPLGPVVAVEAKLATPQLPDREEVALVALVVVGPELDVRPRPAVGRRHPADALDALLHPSRLGDGGVADPVDGDAGRVVGESDHDVAGGAAEAALEALHHGVVVGVGAVLAQLVDPVPPLETLGPLVGVRIEHEGGSHHARRVPGERLQRLGEVERGVAVAAVIEALDAELTHESEVVLEAAGIRLELHLAHDGEPELQGRVAEVVGIVTAGRALLPEHADLADAPRVQPLGAHDALGGDVAVGDGEAVLRREPMGARPADARHLQLVGQVLQHQ